MSSIKHVVGDRLVLKAGLRTVVDQRACRVVGLLPHADHGEQQYRVRFEGENFERRIVASDIDYVETTTTAAPDKAKTQATGGSWLKPGGLRVAK